MVRKALLLCMALCFVALGLCGCNGGTPLEKAANALDKASADHAYKTLYIKDSDTLEIDLGSGDDREFVFQTLNKEIKDQDIGNLYFRMNDTGFVVLAEEEIGKLQCKSMKILGLGPSFPQRGCGMWAPVADKASLVYLDTLPRTESFSYNENKDKILSLKRIWVGDAQLERLDEYPALEELGICARMMPTDRMNAGESTPAGAVNVNDQALAGALNGSDEAAAGAMNGSDAQSGDQAQSSDQSKEEGPTEEEIAKALKKQDQVIFSGDYDRRDQLETVRKAKALKHILIAPTEYSYVPDANGSTYLFLLQNFKGDLLVNPPETKLDVDPLQGGSDEDCMKVSEFSLPLLSDEARWNIVEGFLRDDVKKCYKKGDKLKEKNKRPVINGRALVFKVNEEAEPWKNKKKFYDYGDVLGTKELGKNIPMPQLKGDYQTFVYVYPTYEQMGVYTRGTKAYTQSWYCQVFDFKKGIAYTPEKIASKKPPQKIYYYGTPPKKESGTVKKSKILKYIRKLKVTGAPATSTDAGATGGASSSGSADSAGSADSSGGTDDSGGVTTVPATGNSAAT